jgi:cellulose synthase/poly-beta-1,6-N-acetylglucosamine synthase-like glycosyltransferase
LSPFLYIPIVLTLLYGVSLLVVFAGLFRLRSSSTSQQPMVSVIIACRNEQEHVVALLTALAEQTYPAERYEVILSDDGSTDATAAKAMAFGCQQPRLQLKLVQVKNRDQVVSAKKNALAQAIAASRGELLLFTDADCRPSPDWVAGLTACFTPDVAMVIGFSPYELPNLTKPFHRLLALEALSLAALSAGTAGWGRPASCSGRNLAYRRTVYDRVGGFTQIAQFVSGDDDLFLKLALSAGFRVGYALAPELAVPTFLPASGGQFFHQRLRHASKGLHYGPAMTVVLMTAWVFNLMLLASLFTPYRQAGLILWAIKAIAELPLLLGFAIRMKRLAYFTLWPIAAIAHVLYVVVFGGLGPLLKSNWKEAEKSA